MLDHIFGPGDAFETLKGNTTEKPSQEGKSSQLNSHNEYFGFPDCRGKSRKNDAEKMISKPLIDDIRRDSKGSKSKGMPTEHNQHHCSREGRE